MNQYSNKAFFYCLLGLLAFLPLSSCQDGNLREQPVQFAEEEEGAGLWADQQISRFVRRILEDHRGHLWMGTNGDGVARYDGEKLTYFTVRDGFGGVAVRQNLEDKDGNVWFGTERGVTKYDGHSFTNFNEKDGLIHEDVWSMTIDRYGILWVGTLQGVCRYDGQTFSPFELPETRPDSTRGVTSARIVHSIMQDSKGHYWFGTNGGRFHLRRSDAPQFVGEGWPEQQ